MLYIKEANYADIEKEYAFLRDVPGDENGFGNQWSGISREDFENIALPSMLANAKGENLPAGWVPQTELFLWKDTEIVGLFRIRHYLSEALAGGAGHIGYCIGKAYRGNGYGKEGLRLTLEIARTIIPEDEIYFRVDKDNRASEKVILANGGYVHHQDEHKCYLRIKK